MFYLNLKIKLTEGSVIQAEAKCIIAFYDYLVYNHNLCVIINILGKLKLRPDSVTYLQSLLQPVLCLIK